MNLKTPKGTRDFLPEEMIVRQNMIDTLKGIFERYGFSPLETPIFELYSVLSSKYAGGSEILKETFKFKDQGDRELALRYDLTVPFAKVIGTNPQLKMPFKRYAICPVFRDGPIASARYRQFIQCDVDVVGVKQMAADAEIIALTDTAFKAFGFNATIKINNRKLLNGLLSYCGIKKSDLEKTIIIIDKMDKIGKEGVKKELRENDITEQIITKIFALFTITGTNENKLQELSNLKLDEEGKAGLEELGKVVSFCKALSVEPEVTLSLARGLAYYTGTVFETYLIGSNVKSAVCAGGRYDEMIGKFLGNVEMPAVGISFGLDRLYDALIEKEKSTQKTVTELYIIPIGTLEQSLSIAKQCRDAGVKVDLDLRNKGISKNLDYANSLGIPFVLLIGENELKDGKLKLKDMKTGKEELGNIEEIIEKIQPS